MCRALDKPEWRDDERFATINARAMHVTERLQLTAEVIATNSSAYWLQHLDAEGVPCAPVLSRDDLLTHEQILANDILREYEHPTAGTIRQPRPAARFDKTPAQIRRHAPSLGEHSEELLAELGYKTDEIAVMVKEGVLGVSSG
jgi:crotonobetainyl-CoA:carnitine CoA-transferase CaiB-like acyl-CoA transferase